MMMDKYTEKKTFEEVMEEFRALPFVERQILRDLAAKRLISYGVHEVGSSDINCEVVAIHNEYGDFEKYIEEVIAEETGIHYNHIDE